MVDEPVRRRGAVGVDLLLAGLDLGYLLLAELRIVQRCHAWAHPKMATGEYFTRLPRGLQSVDRQDRRFAPP